MFFQLDLLTLTILLVVLAAIGTSIILFITGTYMMQMYAKSKTWDDSYKLALVINLIWLVSSLTVSILISIIVGDSALIDILRFGINTIVGIIVVKKFYKKTSGESVHFVLVLQIILFIIAIIFGYIFNGIIALVVLG
ncbi:MAG: hypothetical protein KGD68_10920 [Candidatus Lokiarchaeota archaeon]|nr:hypothetical protein [Candidatus Lokiarchaeota archaeon]